MGNQKDFFYNNSSLSISTIQNKIKIK